VTGQHNFVGGTNDFAKTWPIDIHGVLLFKMVG
jgi:hypothetical protein